MGEHKAENQKKFYEEILLNDNGSVVLEVKSGVGENKMKSQYEFFKKIKLTDDGKLCVVIKS